jgi:hypothetical protein
MTTATQAYSLLRARLEANAPTYSGALIPLRWQNEDGGPLPDTPAPFIYCEFIAERAGPPVSFGAGRGANTYRNPAVFDAFVFVPKGWGLTPATDIAESVAALFRSYRDGDVSCFDASVMPGGDGASLKPPGLSSEVGNYFWAAVEVSLHFDQIG